MLVDPHPRAQALVDGFTTYLAQIITAAVLGVHWRVGVHRTDDYPMRNYLVLAAGGHQVFLPGIPLHSAYQSAHGHDPMSGVEMLAHVQWTITALCGQVPVVEEPLVTVVAEVACFDVGLRTDLAEDHPELVERMITELADRAGVASVYRYGPEALVVDAPDWDEIRLTLWLQRHLHTHG